MFLISGHLLKAFDLSAASSEIQAWIKEKRDADANAARLSNLHLTVEALGLSTSTTVSALWGSLDALSTTHRLRFRYVLLMLEAAANIMMPKEVIDYMKERLAFLKTWADEFICFEGMMVDETEVVA
eukprot:6160794-Pyramimonas_sp.AAC.1